MFHGCQPLSQDIEDSAIKIEQCFFAAASEVDQAFRYWDVEFDPFIYQFILDVGKPMTGRFRKDEGINDLFLPTDQGVYEFLILF